MKSLNVKILGACFSFETSLETMQVTVGSIVLVMSEMNGV